MSKTKETETPKVWTLEEATEQATLLLQDSENQIEDHSKLSKPNLVQLVNGLIVEGMYAIETAELIREQCKELQVNRERETRSLEKFVNEMNETFNFVLGSIKQTAQATDIAIQKFQKGV